MKLRRRASGGRLRIELEAPQGWVSVAAAIAAANLSGRDVELSGQTSADTIALLALPLELRARIQEAARNIAANANAEAAAASALPFTPRSFRDFMLYEAHAIDAARGFVRRFMPATARIASAYEVVTRRTFPPLRPSALWYRQPIYYMGNHLTISTDGDDIAIPHYTNALDYELELGFVLAHPLRDATPEAAEAAIGGFVVLNDFSARDVQLAEMRSGFGPQKAKHFASAISAVVVSADEILPRWNELRGSVSINGQPVAECATQNARWSLGEALAHASAGEQLHPGELFGTGTLPGGSGIEAGRLLARGDTVTLAIDGIGTLSNQIT
ncbi:fumarylacetoacetase [Hyphomicrobium sulfonivorans]|nr:fumarylacetoacetate hydrolase family protein [Hyphomicrobium sulfonivorans]NSL71735.1 fumarylacetoacetase [Hyphomicrobium sulfonivorans]